MPCPPVFCFGRQKKSQGEGGPGEWCLPWVCTEKRRVCFMGKRCEIGIEKVEKDKKWLRHYAEYNRLMVVKNA
jgi:hypothetical protein